MDTQQNKRLKICGITRLQDALDAVALGVDALGFVFYDKSSRYITPERAQSIILQLPPFISIVGLFVNAGQKEINAVLDECAIDILQLHGSETTEFCKAQSKRVIKAIPIQTKEDLALVSSYRCSVLLDSKAPKDVYGGTGQTFDWGLLNGFEHDYPLILAGGISLGNVEKAKPLKNIYALDVSSGVESRKGIKDQLKMKQLCEKLR